MSKFSVYSFCVCVFCLFFVFTPLSAQEQPAIPQQVLDWQAAAQSGVKEKDIPKAISCYEQIVQSFPNTSYATDAQCRIVNLYLQNGQTEETAGALAELKQNFASRPEYVKQVHELGWEFVKKQDYATAIQIYKDLQTQFPDHERAPWFQRSIVQTYLEQGDIDKVKQAVEDLENNFQSHPDYANQMTATANRLRGKKQYAIAGGIYDYLLKQLPDNKDAVVWKRMQIQNALDTGQTSTAKAEVETLFSGYKDKPGFVKQIHELGWEFVLKGDYATGLRIYKGLLEQFPNDERAAWFARSIVQTYLEQGDTAKALEAVEQMKTNFQTHPDYVNQMEKLAGVLIDKNQPAAAKGVSETLLEKFPNHSRLPWFLHYKARSEVWMKDPNSADATVSLMQQKYDVHDPNDADAMSWTAYNYRTAGYYQKAIELYEWLLSRNPDPKVQLRSIASIAQAYVRLGNDAKVQEKVDYLLSHFKDNPEGTAFYVYAVAEEYLLAADDLLYKPGKSGEIDYKCQKALKILEPLLDWPQTTVSVQHAWYSMGKALRLRNDYENAAGYYQATVDQWPDYVYAWSSQYFVGYCYEELKKQGGVDPNELDIKIEEAYQKTIEKYPDGGLTWDAYLKLGDLYLRQKRYPEAAVCYEQYQVTADPEAVERKRVIKDLAWIYEHTGQKQRSRSIYEEMLREWIPDTTLRQKIIEWEINRLNRMEKPAGKEGFSCEK